MAYSGSRLVNFAGFNGGQTTAYPVFVFDMNGDLIDQAADAGEVVTLWNGSAVNEEAGWIEQTDSEFQFRFYDKSNSGLNSLLVTQFVEVSPSLKMIGTSYFSGWAEPAPPTYERIYQYWKKGYIGYNAYGNSPGQFNGNNGKVAHDRTRFSFISVDGITNPNTLFNYWGVNDMLYEGNVAGQTENTERAILKIAGSHNAILANAFSKAFNAFADATLSAGATSFPDTNHFFGSKSNVLGANIVSLPTNGDSATFQCYGPIINITHFVSDGYAQVHGDFEVEIDGVVTQTVACNRKTIDLTGQNPFIATEGDAPASPAALILKVAAGLHTIKITNVSTDPVWLDYYSEIVVSLADGAKPVFMANIPSFVNGILISGLWYMYVAKVEAANAAMLDVWNFWKNEIGAPAFLANVYEGFDENTMTVGDLLHFNEAGSIHVMNAFNKQVKLMLGGSMIVL